MQWKYKWLISKTFSLSIIFFHLIYCFFSRCIVFIVPSFSLIPWNSCNKLSNKNNPFDNKTGWKLEYLAKPNTTIFEQEYQSLLIFVKDILRIIKYASSRFKVGDKRLISKQTRQLNVCVFIKCQSFKDRLDQNRQKKGNLSRPPTN